jgi:hypothetical protein
MARTSTSSLVAWTAALFFGVACGGGTFTTADEEGSGGSTSTGGSESGGNGGSGTGGDSGETGGASNCGTKIEAECETDNDCVAAVNVCAACYSPDCTPPRAASKQDVLVGGCLRAWAHRAADAPEGCAETEEIDCPLACAETPECIATKCVDNTCELSVGYSEDECGGMGTGGAGTGGAGTGGAQTGGTGGTSTGGAETGGTGGIETGGTGGIGTGGLGTGGIIGTGGLGTGGVATGGTGGIATGGTGGGATGGTGGGATGGTGGAGTGGSMGGTGGSTGGSGGGKTCPIFAVDCAEPVETTEAAAPQPDCNALQAQYDEAFMAARACTDSSECGGGATIPNLCGCEVPASTTDCDLVTAARMAYGNLVCARCPVPVCIGCSSSTAGTCSVTGYCVAGPGGSSE